MGNFISNFFDSVTGKSSERKANAAIRQGTAQALQAVGASAQVADALADRAFNRALEATAREGI